MGLTLVLLVSNFSNTKLCKNLKNDLNPVPTRQGLDGFQKFLWPFALDESSLSIGWVKVACGDNI